MRLSVIVTLFLGSFNIVSGNFLDPKTFSGEISEEIALEKWKTMDKMMRDTLDSLFKQMLPVFIRSSSEVELSLECTSSMLKVVMGLRQLKEAPLKMIDATGKIPSGIFRGTTANIGHFDECLDVAEYDEYTKELNYQGQYCMVEIHPSLPPRPKRLRFFSNIQLFQNFTTDNYALNLMMKFGPALYAGGIFLGLCVPSTCSKIDIENILSHAANSIGQKGIVHTCEIKEPIEIDSLQYGLIGVIGSIVLLNIFGTMFDVLRQYQKREILEEKVKESIFCRILTSFSVERTVHQLLKTDGTGNRELQCIHGLRFLSMAWVVVGHTYFIHGAFLRKNSIFVKEFIDYASGQVLSSSFLSMEPFFCIGGLVMSYTALQATKSLKKFVKFLPLMIFKRLWRILPSLLLIIGVQILLPLFGSGPFWKDCSQVFSRICRQKWIYNLVFVSNFISFQKQCLPHLWYLSVDFQYFLLAVILMIIFLWKKVWCLWLNVLLVLASIITTAGISYWKDFYQLVGVYTFDSNELIDQMNWIHLSPATHLASYCIGLVAGLYLMKLKEIKLKTIVVFACWCASAAMCLTVIYIPVIWNRGQPYSTLEHLLYTGLQRTTFALGVTWVIVACVIGYGGVANKILSWTGFIPLSRLTFQAYLWHPLVISYFVFGTRDLTYMENNVLVSLFISYLVISYAFAFITHVLYDGPISSLGKILFQVANKGQAKEEITLDVKPTEDTTIFNNSASSKHEAFNDKTEGSYRPTQRL